VTEDAFAKVVWAASFGLPVVGLLCASAAWRLRGVWRAAAFGATLVASAMTYARFVEPRLLLAPVHDIALNGCFAQSGSARLAVFSDAHLGLFPNAPSMTRIAAKLNDIRPDATLFAGDWVYHLDQARFDAALAPLKSLDAPFYSVFGNHDVGLAEPDIHAPFAAALKRAGAVPIDNQMVLLRTKTGAVEFAGFTDFRDGALSAEPLRAQTSVPRLLLTHYPGWAEELRNVDVDLFIAGHTHGGQIHLLGLTCALNPRACEGVRYGLAHKGTRLLFVASGTGMVGLPMRFLAPPRIDVLTLRWRARTPPQDE
jgi:hypothetical protein